MSEDVNITGISDLPLWATESTQEKILAQLSETFSLSKDQKDSLERLVACCQKQGQLGAKAEKNDKKVLKEMEKQGKRQLDLGRKSKELDLGGRNSFGRVGTNMFGTMTSGMQAFTGGLAGATAGLGLANTGLQKFSGFLKSAFTGPGTGFIAGLGLAGQLIGEVITNIKQIAGTMKNLAEYGIQFEGGLVEFSAAMADTGMTMEEMARVSEKYSAVMARNGITSIVSMTNKVGELAGGLDKYGLTTAEAVEYTAEYLEKQRLVGVYSRRSQLEQSKAIQENIARLTAYSKILGVSRKQMEETSKRMLDRDDVQRMFFTMAPEERAKAMDAFNATIQGLTAMGPAGEKVGELLTDMVASPIAQASESFRMLAQVSPEMAMEMVNISEAIKRGEKPRQEQLIQLGKSLSGQKQLIAAFALAGGEVAQTANMLATFGLSAEQAEKMMNDERKKLAETLKVSADSITDAQLAEHLSSVGKAAEDAAHLEDKMNKFRATMEYASIKAFTDLLGKDGKDAVRNAADALGDLTAKLRDWIDETSFFKDLGAKIRELTGTSGLGGILAVLGTVMAGLGLFGTGLGAAGAILMGGPLVWAAAAGTALVGGAGWGIGKAIRGMQSEEQQAQDADDVGKLVDTVRSWFGSEEAKERLALNKQVEEEYGKNAGKRVDKEKKDAAKTEKATPAKVKQEKIDKETAATPKTPAPPKVKVPEKPKTNPTEDLIEKLINSKDTGDQTDLLFDIRALMAESVRKLERVETAIRTNGDAM